MLWGCRLRPRTVAAAGCASHSKIGRRRRQKASLVVRESLGFPLLPGTVGVGIFAEGFVFLDEAAGPGGGDMHWALLNEFH
jgi:hypothetical protein